MHYYDFDDELTSMLAIVLRPEAKLPIHPTLTNGVNGWEFNGVVYGDGAEAEYKALRARAAYWNDSSIHGEDWPVPQGPLTLDNDLEA